MQYPSLCKRQEGGLVWLRIRAHVSFARRPATSNGEDGVPGWPEQRDAIMRSTFSRHKHYAEIVGEAKKGRGNERFVVVGGP